MRGDFVRMMYDASKDKAKYIFGKTVERYEQDENRVVVYFSDGSLEEFDLLVGVDGQGSHIRKAMQPQDGPDPYRRLGIHAAYFFIPRISTDSNICRTFVTTSGRMIMHRTHSLTESGVLFFIRDNSPELPSLPKASIEQQKEILDQKFRDMGWEIPRFLEGMKTTNEFYTQEVVQVRTDTWIRGRVVLLGDAAYCPSPFTSFGLTAGIVGAYVLAGEISKNPDDLPRAFKNYDETLPPFAAEAQEVYPRIVRLAMPKSRLGVTILTFVAKMVFFFRIPKLLEIFSSEDKGGWKLPDYPELPSLGEDLCASS